MEKKYESITDFIVKDYILREYMLEETGEDLYSLIKEEKPLILDKFEGKMFMRGSCGAKPCKGHYQ